MSPDLIVAGLAFASPAGSELAALVARVHEALARTPAVFVAGAEPATATARRAFVRALAEALGVLVAQSRDGSRVVQVYDRGEGRSTRSGARYHQTSEGGGIHTDNVNLLEPWDLLVFGCIAPAVEGGETILVDGRRLVSALGPHLSVLEHPFAWDPRGFSSSWYEAPVLTYSVDGEPRFRYLRAYLEAGHERARRPLTGAQIAALDALDAALDDPACRHVRRMEAGEVLVARDGVVLHGRTAFVDARPGSEVYDESQDPPNRCFERFWVRCPSS